MRRERRWRPGDRDLPADYSFGYWPAPVKIEGEATTLARADQWASAGAYCENPDCAYGEAARPSAFEGAPRVLVYPCLPAYHCFTSPHRGQYHSTV